MKNIPEKEFLEKEYQKIKDLFSKNKFSLVIEKSKKVLKKNPNQTVFYNFIGVSYRQLGKVNLSIKIFNDGLKINPNDENLLINLAGALRSIFKFENSKKIFQQVLSVNPNNINALINYGNLKRDTNDFDEAIELYEKAYAKKKDEIIIMINLAGVYQIVGSFKKSKQILEEALEKYPHNALVHKLLSHTITYEENNSHQKKMITSLNKDLLNDKDKATLCFAIAKSYEDQKNYEKSFEFFKKAKDIQSKIHSNYSVQEEVKLFNKIKKIFDNTNFNDYPKFENNNKKLIFIIGLPRSGTTLTHQIIASHSEVYGAGEVVILDQFMKANINNKNLTKIFEQYSESNKDSINEIINSYFSNINYLKSKKNIILDKNPLNFQWIGFIKILFPGAKIIHCKRNLKETALSIYKNAFEINSIIWSNKEDHLLQYIKSYLDLMEFWEKKIPNFIYNLNYQKLVEDQENEIKKLINFCDLIWEEDCLKFNEKASSIKTVSIAQARKPIYKTSLKSYEKYYDYLPLLKKIDDI